MTRHEILALFQQWNNAIQTGEPKKAAALYAKNAVLLPTISNTVCQNHQDIETYFAIFMARKPIGKIDMADVRIFDQLATNTGVYTFSFKDGTCVKARFTFIYQLIDNRWLISHHHSSQMPE